MRMSFRFAALLLTVGASAVGQEKTASPGRKPGDVDIQFANGSNVRMMLDAAAIEVKTPYGMLSVPVRDIKQIEFGVHISEEIEKQIEDALRKLNAENFRDREAATNTLLKLGADAYPAVYEAARTPSDLEGTKRVKAVLQTMTKKIPEKDLRLQYNDSIVTPTFTISGRIVTPTIKAKAEYFGPVELRIAQLRLLRSTDTPAEANVFVDAAKYASQNGDWMATDFVVDARSRISVTASGSVNLRPNIIGAALESGPNGYPMTAAAIAKGLRRSGQLLGRVGETGPTFFIGDHYEGTPGREGKLYLQIFPSQYNPESTGGYQVKINVKH
jgi:hypothetical protein